MWITRILALVKKEFLALFQDKKSRFVVIVPPLLQMMVFGYAASFDLNHIALAVLDEDGGAQARELIGHFTGSRNFDLVERLSSQEEIAPLMDRRGALVLLHVSPQFSRNLARGTGAPVQVIVDGRNSNTALVAVNYVRGIVSDFNERYARAHGRQRAPAHLVTRAWFNPNLESRWFIVSGIVGLITTVVTMLVTALSVAREREHGTFDQLLVTPMRPVEILIGKALPGFIVGFFESTLIILVAIYWFKVPLVGSVGTLYVGLVLFLLAIIGVGLMISSLAVTQQQGLLGAFLFMVPAVILSGFATPIANMPEFVQDLTLINPLRYFLIIVRGVFLEGTPFEILIPQFWPMAIIALVNLALAGWLFRHRMY